MAAMGKYGGQTGTEGKTPFDVAEDEAWYKPFFWADEGYVDSRSRPASRPVDQFSHRFSTSAQGNAGFVIG